MSFRYDLPADEAHPFALVEIDLTVRRGEIVALIGRNGSGKTTLAKHLNGLLMPVAGRVLIDGEDTRRTTVARLAARVGYAFQNPDHQLFAATVAEDVAFGPRNLGLPPPDVARRVDAALQALGLEPVADRHPLLLGYGARRLVALAGVLALGTRLLVLDEPTAGLDRRMAERVLAVLAGHRAGGGAALVITHDLSLVAALATRVVVLRDGALIADAPPRAVLTDDVLLGAAGLAPPPVTRLARRLAPYGVRGDALTVDELCDSVATVYRGPRATAAAFGSDG